MTVDVEDYFQVYAFFHCIPRDSWDRYACRVEANVDTSAQFADAGVLATFFTLGWIAERHKAMVRRIILTCWGLNWQRSDHHRRVDAAMAGGLRRSCTVPG